jgi:hypothetical protein
MKVHGVSGGSVEHEDLHPGGVARRPGAGSR